MIKMTFPFDDSCETKIHPFHNKADKTISTTKFFSLEWPMAIHNSSTYYHFFESKMFINPHVHNAHFPCGMKQWT